MYKCDVDQLTLFESILPTFKFAKPIRLIELFAGYGSQAMAFEKLEEDKYLCFERYKVVEFDKYAIRSYNVIHQTNYETLDIRNVNANDLEITSTDQFDYVMFYSFPCQSVSKIGKQKGMVKGSDTRSSLLWEVERILKECDCNGCLPQVLLMENVPEVAGKKNYSDFAKWYATLEKMGYQSYYKMLNAKNFGIPQNRDRCFMVSLLGNHNYIFPKPFALKRRLKDLLEDNVAEKYYLSEGALRCYMDNTDRNGFIRANRFKPHKLNDEYAWCITTSPNNRVTDNFLIVENKNCKATTEVSVAQKPHRYNKGAELNICPNIASNSFQENNFIKENKNERIRKFTPRECGRLMGVSDENITKMLEVNSDCQCYKQFGNSIVVDVLYYILKQMCKEKNEETI